MTESTLHRGSRFAVLVRNAGWNLLRGLASSGVSVVLPVALAAILGVSEYRAWALVFGLAAFVGYLDLGIPTSVQALVARAHAVGSQQGMARAGTVGILVVAVLCAITVAIAVVVALFLGLLFPAVPGTLRDATGVALVAITVGQTSNLLGNVAAAYFAGQQRAKVSALVLTPARLVALGLALLAAFTGGGLEVIAMGFAGPLVLGALVMLALVAAEAAGRLSADFSRVLWREAGSLISYSGPLMLWSFCVLFTSGAGVVVVGRLDYANVAVYSFGTVIASALIGFQSAVSGPLLPEFAARWVSKQYAALAEMLSAATALNGAALFGLAGVVTAMLPVLLSGFLAVQESGTSWLIVTVVVIGNVVHLLGGPLSIAFIASGRHARILFPPLIEALLSVGLSIVLGIVLGALGVAVAELVAALIGLMLGFSWSIRRAGLPAVSGRTLAKTGLLRPLAAFSPFVLACLAQVLLPGSWVGITLGAGFFAIGVVAVLGFGLPRSTAKGLIARLRSRAEA